MFQRGNYMRAELHRLRIFGIPITWVLQPTKGNS